ncbi:hypothetical protein [Streptomyces sp. Ag109_O5-1]|nr:hypothetical protein [Streptomyces sp. Ag109_O5-1]
MAPSITAKRLRRGFGFRCTRLRRLTGAQTRAGLRNFAHNLTG